MDPFFEENRHKHNKSIEFLPAIGEVRQRIRAVSETVVLSLD